MSLKKIFLGSIIMGVSFLVTLFTGAGFAKFVPEFIHGIMGVFVVTSPFFLLSGFLLKQFKLSLGEIITSMVLLNSIIIFVFSWLTSGVYTSWIENLPGIFLIDLLFVVLPIALGILLFVAIKHFQGNKQT